MKALIRLGINAVKIALCWPIKFVAGTAAGFVGAFFNVFKTGSDLFEHYHDYLDPQRELELISIPASVVWAALGTIVQFIPSFCAGYGIAATNTSNYIYSRMFPEYYC